MAKRKMNRASADGPVLSLPGGNCLEGLAMNYLVLVSTLAFVSVLALAASFTSTLDAVIL